MTADDSAERNRIRIVSYVLILAVGLFGLYSFQRFLDRRPAAAPPGSAAAPDRSSWPERGLAFLAEDAAGLARDSAACRELRSMGFRWIVLRVPAWLPDGAARLEYRTSALAESEETVRALRDRGFAVAVEAAVTGSVSSATEDGETVRRTAGSYGAFLRDLAARAAGANADLLHLGDMLGHPAFPAGEAMSIVDDIRATYAGALAIAQREDAGTWTSLAARCDRVVSTVRPEDAAAGRGRLPEARVAKRHCLWLEPRPEPRSALLPHTWEARRTKVEDARVIAVSSAALVAALRARDPREGFWLPGQAVLTLLRADPHSLRPLAEALRLTGMLELRKRLERRTPELRQSPAAGDGRHAPRLRS